LYSPTAGAPSIAGYSINSSTLTALSGGTTDMPTGTTSAWAMAVAPSGNYLYVSTNNGILIYTIGSGGTLTLNTSGSLGDLTSYALEVDSTGQWLLDASNTTAGPVLYAWPISASTGLPATFSISDIPGLQLSAGNSVGEGGIAISNDDKLVAVAAGNATYTVPFTAGNGTITTAGPFGTAYKTTAKSGATAISVAFESSSSPKFLYIGETGDFTSSGGLRMIPIASDVPGTEPSTSPYPSGGTGPHAILANSNGYVYVANYGGTGAGNVTAFLVNASIPSLTVQSSPAVTGDEPLGMAVDNTGDFVIVINSQGTSPVDAYTFDATTTGLLDAVSLTGSAGSNPVAIVAVPK
jgi:hypothetical protein